jgi:hypothetical protein
MKHAALIIATAICLALASCGEHAGSTVPVKVDSTASVKAAPPTTEKLVLDTFDDKGIPDSLMSTSCTFSDVKDSDSETAYILFVADAGGRVLFYTGHKAVLLPISEMETLSKEDQQQWKDNNIEVYTDGYYTLRLKRMTGKQTGEESEDATGTMTVSTKDGKFVKVELTGGCGS